MFDVKNPYKRTDVFSCNYKSHSRFDNRVSVYHVMRTKNCYPQGCIVFKWSCVLKNKGKKCVRGFQHIGRLCDGCSHYTDEKMHYQPRIKLTASDYSRFESELEEFEDWLAQFEHRDLDIWCEVTSVKPRFKKEIIAGKGQIRLDGYLLFMQQGFIGTVEFDDAFFVSISPRQQQRYDFAPGDRFEARGNFTLDRGRIVFTNVWHIDFEYRSRQKTWSNSQALVAKQSAAFLDEQPETCLHCPKGALVDVVEKSYGQTKLKRELFCLEGVKDYSMCCLAAVEKINRCAHI